jgi:ABC-type transporter Mla MlaB component
MPSSGPHSVAFAIYGPINDIDLCGLDARVCRLFEESPEEVVLCDVAGVEPDATTVDALARLQLAAQRRGCVLRLRNASEELVELVAFMGVTEVFVDR